MTNETMLEISYRLLDLLVRNPAEAVRLLMDTRDALKEDIRHDAMKAKGLGSRDKLLQRMQRSIPQDRKTRGWHPCDGDRYGFVDGYRCYVVNEDYGFPAAEQPFACDRVLQSLPHRDPVELQVDRAQIRAFLKVQRALVRAKKQPKVKPAALDAGDFQIGFNAEYLLEFCDFFQTSSVYVTDPRSPATYTDPETGEWGILMPCHLDKAVPV